MQARRWVAGIAAAVAVAAAGAAEQPDARPPAGAERHVVEPAAGSSTPEERWSDTATSPERAGTLLLVAAVALLVVRALRNRD
jgi:hypothetical protein